jgi:hypothetical protein
MPILRYRDYYISVLHVPDKSGDASCIACVEVRHKLDGHPTVRFQSRSTTAILSETNEQGFAMGKRWIDDHLSRKPGYSGLIATEAPAPLFPMRFRLGARLASLIERLSRLVSSRFAGAERRS